MASVRNSIQNLLNSTDEVPYHQRRITINGREYMRAFYHRLYPFPCDKEELERLDMFGTILYYIVLSDDPERVAKASFAPLGSRERARVLDVGCGTGWWILLLAENRPRYEYVGIDLAQIQPGQPANKADDLHPNVRIDFDAPVDMNSGSWGRFCPPNSFDLVHAAQLLGSVHDWSRFYRTVYEYVKPGGWAEFVEIDWTPRYDGLCNEDDRRALEKWWNDLVLASQTMGRSIQLPLRVEQLITRAGFVNIRHEMRAMNCGRKAARFYADERERWRADACYRGVTGSMGCKDLRPWSGLSMELLTRFGGYTRAEVEALDARLCDAILRPENPFYFNIHVWTAGKPMY
ncbi:S-adenosyl-L-methionine-dependent methyltransferase [Piedraia hortae CBS 480.64]|uniref:S-adenosyl-L-methionine-dependent methyltransferase n=1 Tax=Piedraia hortae CBS 480.64 TaxID=1314780 RepID=A0A6A7BT09_9PEZI|nr:S-adenosyl-L-methionine-dependent methyltransferase [Piedraia hortae CBS 480.64]